MNTMTEFAISGFALLVVSFLAVSMVLRQINPNALKISYRQHLTAFAACTIFALLVSVMLYRVNIKMTRLIDTNFHMQTEYESVHLRNTMMSQPKYQDTLRLARFEAKVFSQNGEDGIIAEIFRRIGTINRYFVDFGSSDGMENNTVFLLKQGWSGLWLDGDPKRIKRASQHFAVEIKAKRLTAGAAFITAENIEKLFSDNGVLNEPDLLSIDIDRNDYYVWKAITRYRPRVVVIEYNAIFSPGMKWVIDYDPNAWWDGTGIFGASLSALEAIGEEKGYSLVGCTISGVNAFFVRNDILHDKFCKPYTALNHYEPPRYWLTWGEHHRRP
jgi:hypothetical protein